MSYKDTESYKQMVKNNKLMMKMDKDRNASISNSKKGWTGESERHRLASYGIKSGRKPTMMGHIATKQERKKDPYLSKDSIVYGKTKGGTVLIGSKKQVNAVLELEKKVKKPKITPMPKGTNVWDVEDPEGAGLTEAQNNQIWQHLVDTGMAWSLQGWYGRTASAMIDAGIIHKKR